jgi:hypothetical protein
MSLSRSRAEELGVVFAVEDDFRGAPDPDVPNFRAEITRNDTTLDFAGKSEEHVLEQVEARARAAPPTPRRSTSPVSRLRTSTTSAA